MPREELKLKINPSGSISPLTRVIIETPTPLLRLDTAAIHLYTKVDSLWYDADFTFRPDTANIRRYTIKADGSYFDGSFKNGQPDQGSWYSKSGTPL